MAAGLEPGDRAAIWAPNMHEWIVAALGLHSAGGVLDPAQHPLQGPRGGRHPRPGRGPAAVHGDRLPRHRLRGPAREAYGGPGRAAGGGPARPRAHRRAPRRRARRRQSLGRLPAPRRRGPRPRWPTPGRWPSSPDDLSDILFTSGTTGQPKGVMTTHGQNLRAFRAWADVVGLRAGDRYLSSTRSSTPSATRPASWPALMMGRDDPAAAVFDVPAVLARIAAERITVLPGPPTLYQTILNHPDLADLRPLVAAPGGHRRGGDPRRADPAHAPRAALRDDHHRLRPHRVVRHRDHVPLRRRSRDHRHHVGAGHPRRRGARASTTTGDEVPRGEPGEVVVRGYNVMHGYFDDPERDGGDHRRRRLAAHRRHRR